MNLQHANPALFAALHRAQQCAKTVGKDGTNQHQRRKYATAEAMLEEAKRAMADHGLAVLMTSSKLDHVAEPDVNASQYVCATMTIEWALTHCEGGYITGETVIDVVASKATPPDKASRADETYAMGFLVRGLLALNRGDEEEADVERREEHGTAPRRESVRQSQQAKPKAEFEREQREDYDAAVEEKNKAWSAYRAQHAFEGLPAPVWAETLPKICHRMGMNEWPEHDSADMIRTMANIIREMTKAVGGPPPAEDTANGKSKRKETRA